MTSCLFGHKKWRTWVRHFFTSLFSASDILSEAQRA
jgi:hypothetical protein